MSLQEKFQIMTPYSKKADDDGNNWADFKSVRETGDAGRNHQNNTTADEICGSKFNYPGTGSDIGDQMRSEQNNMPLSMAGATDVSDHVNAETFKKGFKRHEMGCCDDQYSGEHIDLFYGEATGDDGEVGFIERNNYCDRA